MYPSSSPVTTMGMQGQGSVPHPACVYERVGSSTSGFSQYDSANNIGARFPSFSAQSPNTRPSYPQPSQGLFQVQMQQQAANTSYQMQTSLSSSAPGLSQNPQPRFPNKPYLGQAAPPSSFYPRGPSLAQPEMSHQVPVMSAIPRQRPTTQPAPAGFGPQSIAPPMYEQSIHKMTNPNYNLNNINSSVGHQYPSLQQSIHPPQPLEGGQQNSWRISKHTPQNSTSIGAMAPPGSDYVQQNRQIPASVYGPGLPDVSQTSAAVPTAGILVQIRIPEQPMLCLNGTLVCEGGATDAFKVGQIVTTLWKGKPYEATVISKTEKDLRPRLCHIIKGSGYPIFGFDYVSLIDDGPYIRNVDQNSAAESAGLKPGDKIIEVNGFNVERETNDAVLLQMKGLPNEMKLLVADRATLVWYSKRGVKINSSLPVVRHLSTRLRSPGASVLYQRQNHHQSVSGNPIAPPLLATNAEVPRTQPVPVRRPYTYGVNSNENMARPGAECTVPPSDYTVTEPDDRKLLGQWYAQPQTPQPAKHSTQNSETENSAVTSQCDINSSSVEPVPVTSASETVIPSVVPDLVRPESPTELMQAKIFDMIKKGTPLTLFNNPTTTASDSASASESLNTDVRFSYVGSYIIKQSGLAKVTDPDIERQSIVTPPSQQGVSGDAQQETSSQEPQPTSDTDTKEGITLINSDTSEVTEKRRETENETNGSNAEFLASMNLANQLDIDKNRAMSSLQMPLYPALNSNDQKKSDRMDINTVSAAVSKTPSICASVTSSASISAVPQTNNSSKHSAIQTSLFNTTPSVPTGKKTEQKPKNFTGSKKDSSKKLKVKFTQPIKKASGSESPSKKITMTWKKKMAAKAMLAENALSIAENALSAEVVSGPTEENIQSAGQNEEQKQTKKQKKKRTSLEAQLNDESNESPSKKRGRGRGSAGGRGRGRGQGPRTKGQAGWPGRGKKRGGKSAHAGRGGRGRGRGRDRGRKILPYALKGSLKDYFKKISAEATADEPSHPTVEVDVDEVPHAVTADEVYTNYKPANNDSVDDKSSEKINIDVNVKRENQVIEAATENSLEIVDVKMLKTEPIQSSESEERVTERSLVPETTRSLNCSEQSIGLHASDNLIHRTENYTLSWVSFHGCKMLLITSSKGDFLVMKELVFEVFRPRRPEKDQPGHHSEFKGLSQKLKIQHIYKTKEKKLKIMYSDIDTEIFEVVHQILIDKRALHKKQDRLGVLSLADALRLYHFVTIVGQSECIDIGESCVKPHDSQNYRQKRRSEMDLRYPIDFTDSSSQSPKTLQDGQSKKNLKKADVKPPPKPIDVIDLVSSDEDSCQSDATLPYVDGIPVSNISERNIDQIEVEPVGSIIPDSASGSLGNENSVSTETVVTEDNQIFTNTESTHMQSSSAIQNIVNEKVNTKFEEPSLFVAPQCLSTILLMDSMTKSNVEHSSEQRAVSVVLDDEDQPAVPVSEPDKSEMIVEEALPIVSEVVSNAESRVSTDFSMDIASVNEKENADEGTMISESSESVASSQHEQSVVDKEKTEKLPEATSNLENRFKGVKEFFDVMYDEDYEMEIDDDDDLVLIDLDGNEELLIAEGEKRVDELLEKRCKAKTEEEIGQVWAQALRFQRPVDQLKRAILDGFEKQMRVLEQDEELERLKQENEELRRFVEQHKEYLDSMPECDRMPASQDAGHGDGDKS